MQSSRDLKVVGGLSSSKVLGIFICLFLSCTFSFPLASFAQSQPIAKAFIPEPELAPRVEFWKLIFTKYGKDHAVFHDRNHPHIIYSVLDFSELAKGKTDKVFKEKKKTALKRETQRIKALLEKLAARGPGSSDSEKRIYRLYKNQGDATRLIKIALQKNNIRSQTGIRERFRDGIRRSGRYLHAIEKIFRDANLPVELARLPLVESSFDYQAYSSVGAAGIWQFMRSTGRLYMRVNSAVDERRDPIVATRGAVRYLGSAYKRLGSWPLAVTSYNHGVAGVSRAVKASGTKDLAKIIARYKSRTFGFASSNFFVELMAAIEIEQNPQKYFPGIVIEKPWQFDEVKLANSTSIATLRKAIPVGEAELKQYNPGLLRSVFQGRRSIPAGYLVRLPKGTGSQFASKLKNTKVVSLEEGTKLASSYKPSRSSSTRYRVRRGDTFSSIARRFGVGTKTLMSYNGIRNAKKLYVGRTIKIPSGGRSSSRSRVLNYTVRRGDSLGSIAKKNGVKLSSLRKLNPRVKNTIHPGQKIRVR